MQQFQHFIGLECIKTYERNERRFRRINILKKLGYTPLWTTNLKTESESEPKVELLACCWCASCVLLCTLYMIVLVSHQKKILKNDPFSNRPLNFSIIKKDCVACLKNLTWFYHTIGS